MAYPPPLAAVSMRAAFTRVYDGAAWTGGSGPGSGEAETAVWRSFLAAYLRENDVHSVLDLGCGDWQSTRLTDWSGIAYHGIDVVPGVVEACRDRYAAPGVTFRCADITTCPLPAADLIICKEVLQHWPNATVKAFRRRLAWRRCLLVNDWAPVGNPDIRPGGYRPLDLAAPPFRWPVREVCRWTLSYANGDLETKVVHEM
jgi:SAM-dependent methyltransferase